MTKFTGTFEQLCAILSHLGIEGRWQPEPNGVFMFRTATRANMHWASGSKTIWFDGPPKAVEALRERLMSAHSVAALPAQ